MTDSIRVVAPFRPFPPEAPHHQELAAFDWMDAIAMLTDSVRASCGVELRVLTDVDTDLPCSTLQYQTTHRRLMLWYLEIAACYLDSPAFDRDTIALDSDQLVYQDLASWFASRMDIGIVIRATPKGLPGFPILNGVQFWAHRAKAKLVEFYRDALAIAEQLPEADIVWGADTVALCRLLEPLSVGMHDRSGLRVRFIQGNDLIEALSLVQIRHLEAGKMQRPTRPVLDFRNTRKPYMRAVYEATIARTVQA